MPRQRHIIFFSIPFFSVLLFSFLLFSSLLGRHLATVGLYLVYRCQTNVCHLPYQKISQNPCKAMAFSKPPYKNCAKDEKIREENVSSRKYFFKKFSLSIKFLQQRGQNFFKFYTVRCYFFRGGDCLLHKFCRRFCRLGQGISPEHTAGQHRGEKIACSVEGLV